MAVQYAVQAEVVDIRQDNPTGQDLFLVDTNVWYWLTYSRASQVALPHQVKYYPSYIKRALGAKARLFRVGLSLAELAHLVEGTERKIYEASNGKVQTKEYRHNLPTERTKVVAEIKSAWAQVKSMTDPLGIVVDDPVSTSALNRLDTQIVDGYDLFILEAMDHSRLPQVVTDDGDYSTVPGIRVFTANLAVLQAAQAEGRLVVR